MQVFIPHDDFQQSIACLDYRRLGKQRIECEQILAALRSLRAHESGPGLPAGWTRHPATLMWKGHDSALAVYLTMADAEWRARGYNSTRVTPYDPETFLRREGWWSYQDLAEDGRDATLPWWWGREDVHKSHQRALMYKDPEWYRQWGWRVVPRLDYVWPVEKEDADVYI